MLQRTAELEEQFRTGMPMGSPPMSQVLANVENHCADLATTYAAAARFEGIASGARADLEATSRRWLERSEMIRVLLAEWVPE